MSSFPTSLVFLFFSGSLSIFTAYPYFWLLGWVILMLTEGPWMFSWCWSAVWWLTLEAEYLIPPSGTSVSIESVSFFINRQHNHIIIGREAKQTTNTLPMYPLFPSYHRSMVSPFGSFVLALVRTKLPIVITVINQMLIAMFLLLQRHIFTWILDFLQIASNELCMDSLKTSIIQFERLSESENISISTSHTQFTWMIWVLHNGHFDSVCLVISWQQSKQGEACPPGISLPLGMGG